MYPNEQKGTQDNMSLNQICPPRYRRVFESRLDPKKVYLNLSHVRLTDEQLPYLAAFLNQHPTITTLDISNNYVFNIQALENTTTLTTFIAKDTSICDYRFLKKNLQLTTLECSSSVEVDSLSTLDTLKTLVAPFKFSNMHEKLAFLKSTKIENLSFLYAILEVDDAKAINENITIRYLSLRKGIMKEGVAVILAKNEHLQTLELNNSNLSAKDMSALTQSETLKILDISENACDADTFVSLINNSKLNGLRARDVNRNWSYHNGLVRVANAIARNCTLRVLDVGANNLSDEHLMTIAGENKRLSELNVSENLIADKGALALSKMPLQYLNISVNKNVGFEGAEALYLRRLKSIEASKIAFTFLMGAHFHLKSNPLYDRNAIRKFFEYLKFDNFNLEHTFSEEDMKKIQEKYEAQKISEAGEQKVTEETIRAAELNNRQVQHVQAIQSAIIASFETHHTSAVTPEEPAVSIVTFRLGTPIASAECSSPPARVEDQTLAVISPEQQQQALRDAWKKKFPRSAD
jgi:predicted transposase YbfD/YdcC